MSPLAAAKRPPPRKRNVTPASELEPEATVTDRNDRIHEMAYFLWLEEGCPEGAAERHWLAAETLVDSEPLELIVFFSSLFYVLMLVHTKNAFSFFAD